MAFCSSQLRQPKIAAFDFDLRRVLLPSKLPIFLVDFKQFHIYNPPSSGFLLARSEEEGVNPNMEAPHPKLSWVTQQLRVMEASWREDGSAPPTAEELALYQLLLLHVDSEFSLFHKERILRQFDSNDQSKVEFIIKELRNWKNTCPEPSVYTDFKCEEGNESDEGDENYSRHAEELANTSNPLLLLIELLEECRAAIAKQSLLEECNLSIAKLKLPGKGVEMATAGSRDATMTPTEADCCAEAMMEDELPYVKEEEARPDTLRNMLSYLEDMRRDRAYAPPRVGELECYREIRKLITSTYMYLQAKGEWQYSWQQHDWLKRCSMPDSGCCFAQLIPRICNGKREVQEIETSHGLFRPPTGHVFELAFDEMPDTESLLVNCKRKLSDTITGLSLEKIDWRSAVKCSNNSLKDCSRKCVGGKNLREKLLRGILKAFRRMNSLCSTTRPTSREVRLFDWIAEHVESTAVAFYSLQASEESQPYRVNLFEAIPRNLDKLDTKMDTRAAYLEKIMLGVEAINSLYGGTPPTKHQMRIYDKICHHVSKARRQIYGEEQLQLSADDLTMAREMLEIIYKKEMDFFHGLMDEYKEMLHMIFTTVPRGFNSADTFMLLEGKKDNAVNELKLRVTASPQGPEILERALLILYEACDIHDALAGKFYVGNDEVNGMITDEKNGQLLLKELWTAAQILQSPRVKQSLSDSKLRLNGVFEVSKRSL